MDRSEILDELNAIFVDTLDNDEIQIAESTTTSEIEEWDSLTHIQLVVAVEKHFKIRFTSQEIRSWSNVGDMLNYIEGKKS